MNRTYKRSEREREICAFAPVSIHTDKQHISTPRLGVLMSMLLLSMFVFVHSTGTMRAAMVRIICAPIYTTRFTFVRVRCAERAQSRARRADHGVVHSFSLDRKQTHMHIFKIIALLAADARARARDVPV